MAYKYNWELLIYCSSYKINRCECTWIVRFSFLCLRFSFVCLVSLKCRMRVCKRVSYITTHITQINLSCAGWYWLRKRLSNGRQLWKTPRTFFFSFSMHITCNTRDNNVSGNVQPKEAKRKKAEKTREKRTTTNTTYHHHMYGHNTHIYKNRIVQQAINKTEWNRWQRRKLNRKTAPTTTNNNNKPKQICMRYKNENKSHTNVHTNEKKKNNNQHTERANWKK